MRMKYMTLHGIIYDMPTTDRDPHAPPDRIASKPAVPQSDAQSLIGVQDLDLIEHLFQLTSVDLSWLLGVTTGVLRRSADAPIKDNKIALLVQLLLDSADRGIARTVAPIPVMPDVQSTFDAIAAHWPPENLRARLPESYRDRPLSSNSFGVLFGVGAWTANQWRRGTRPSMATLRLFWMVTNLIDAYGSEGLAIYVEIVEKTARKSGIEGGIPDLLKYRSWNKK